MDKILISNSFKNLLQSLGAKTSNSNYAVPVVTAGSGTTAGTPQGYMDMASLASVLGVPTIAAGVKVYVKSNDDLNNLTVYPCYSCKSASIAATVTNMPSNASISIGFVILNIQPYDSSGYETQLFVQAGSMWSRVKNVPEWSTWKQFAFVQ